MSRPVGSMIFAIVLTFVGAAALADSAIADDRTVWRSTDGMSIRKEAGGTGWRVYRADGTQSIRLVEVERTARHVTLYDGVTQKHLRLESGRMLVSGRRQRDWTKAKDGDWVRTVQPTPTNPIAAVWIMDGGRAGFLRETGSTWREYSTAGEQSTLYTEQERGSTHVLIHNAARGLTLRLESGRCYIKMTGMSHFTPQWEGDWAGAAPAHWQVPGLQAAVTSVWLIAGGLAGFRQEDGTTWREFNAGGNALALYAEQERGNSHVLLYDAGRQTYVRLESGRSLIKLPGRRDFSPQWNGSWANAAPTHWRTQQSQGVVTENWVIQGGRAGFRLEGGTTWKEYGAAGRQLNTFSEQERGNSHVLLYHTSRRTYVRLENGRCLIKLPGKRVFSPQWNGSWATRAPSHWQTPAPQTVVTSVWLIKGGLAGYMQEDEGKWREYSTGGKPLALYTERERSNSSVQLDDPNRGLSVRLEAGRSYLKLRGHARFSPQWEGNWATQAPPHWRIAEPQTQPAEEIWLLTGGGGYRREGSPPYWVAYGPDGRSGMRFGEESRGTGYVQIREPSLGLRMRLLAGELQVQEQGTGRFVRQATGNWADRAPSNWPVLPTTSRVTTTWVYEGGGGFHRTSGNLWAEYNVDGSRKKDFTEKQRTPEFVLLHGRGRAGRDILVQIQKDRSLVLRQGMGGWTLLSMGRWTRRVPSHWRTGDPSPGTGGPTRRRSLWKGANQDFYQNDSGRWTHYQGRSGRPMLEYTERDRTRQYVELWNPAQSLGARLYSDHSEIWNRRLNRWNRGQNGAWTQQAPHVPVQPIRQPTVVLSPLFTESVNCTQIGSQTPQVNLRVARKVGMAGDGNRYAHLSLDNSTVTATRGALTDNRDERRGFYLESVKVTIEPVGNRLSIHSDGPGTFTGKGGLTSVSGVNLTSGQPLSPTHPQVWIGNDDNFGMRHTESYVDFHVVNGTRAPKVEHTYGLATVIAPGSSWNRSGGTVLYRTWKDLAAGSPGDNDLCGLPPRTVKNFPLISQATFMAPANYTGTASVKVTLEITFRHVKKEGRFISLKVKDKSQVDLVERTFEFDFGGLK